MQVNKKQKYLLDLLISSSSAFTQCARIIKPEYFDPELRKAVAHILDYYHEYSAIPSVDNIEANVGIALTKHDITPDEESFVSDETERFCRRQAVIKALQSAPSHINDDNYGAVEEAIREAIGVKLDSDIGVNYFEHPYQRLEKQAESLFRLTTGLPDLDTVLGGGLARTETLLVTANSGGGKSITMSNFAANYLKQGLDVAYISLELSESLVSQRFDVMFTGISSVTAHLHQESIAGTIVGLSDTYGRLTIKRLPNGSNSNDINAYIREYFTHFGKYPDVLVLDYLDELETNEGLSRSNISQHDKAATAQFYELGVRYNMVQITASQQNRSALESSPTDQNQGHIQGGLTKYNAVDAAFSIIFTPAMKAQGEIAFAITKLRSGDGLGTVLFFQWDNARLKINQRTKQDKTSVPTSKFAGRGASVPQIDNSTPPDFSLAGKGAKPMSLVDLANQM